MLGQERSFYRVGRRGEGAQRGKYGRIVTDPTSSLEETWFTLI
jgi:hypothetical protein